MQNHLKFGVHRYSAAVYWLGAFTTDHSVLSLETERMNRYMKFHDAHQSPFSLHGLVQEPGYRRLPESMLDSIRPPLKRLAQQTSGGRIRFATDANEMVIRITLSDTVIKTHMTPLNKAGAELYAGAWRCSGRWPQARAPYPLKKWTGTASAARPSTPSI